MRWIDEGREDSGQGSIKTFERNPKYPGVLRVREISYCGRSYENKMYYIAPGEKTGHEWFNCVAHAMDFASGKPLAKIKRKKAWINI